MGPKGFTTKPTKYTEEFVMKELKEMIKEIRLDKDILYIKELFEMRDYTIDRFSEWRRVYKDHPQIPRLAMKIKDILETRAVKWAITKNFDSWFTKFFLCNKYNWWTDNKKIDINKAPDVPEENKELDNVLEKAGL